MRVSGAGKDWLIDTEYFISLLQAVTIVEGKKSVDVGVTLCYCNEDLCNEELSGAHTPVLSVLLLSVVNILVILRITE